MPGFKTLAGHRSLSKQLSRRWTKSRLPKSMTLSRQFAAPYLASLHCSYHQSSPILNYYRILELRRSEGQLWRLAALSLSCYDLDLWRWKFVAGIEQSAPDLFESGC